MANTRNRVLARIFESIDGSQLSEDAAKLVEQLVNVSPVDIGLSSMEHLALLNRIGDDFDVKFPPEEVSNFRSLKDVIAYLER